MPLSPTNEAPEYGKSVIRFPMSDGKREVMVRVDQDELRSRAAFELDGSHIQDIAVLFERYRPDIEAVASAKYDDNPVEDVIVTLHELF